MKYPLFLLFSSMESFSIVLLGLILFRIRLKSENIIKAITIGFILATVSLILTLIQQSAISPVVQILLMFTLIKFMYQTRALHTLLITVTPYILFALVQTIFIMITTYYGAIKFDELIPFTFKGYIIQFVSFLIVIIIASFLKKTNEGYAFIPEESTKKVRYSNKLLFLIVSVSGLLYSIMLYEYKTTFLLYSFVILSLIISASALIIIYVTLQRDIEEFRV